MADDDKVSRLVQDLKTLPGVVGNMGVSIADAQKLMNKSYLETVLAFIKVYQNTVKTADTSVHAVTMPEKRTFIESMGATPSAPGTA